MSHTLVIFRNDLRSTDNPAVDQAIRAGTEACTGLFIATPEQWKRQDWGDPKAAFVGDCVASLSKDLASRNVPLLYRESTTFSDYASLAASIAADLGCLQVHINRDVGVDETRRDQELAALLESAGIELHIHEGNTVLPSNRIRTGSDEPFKVFTPFRKRWQHLVAAEGLTVSGDAIAPPNTNVVADPIPSVFTGFDDWPGRAQWIGGSAEAGRRLNQFLDNAVDHYHTQRDHPWIDGTSALSPWFAAGALSPVTALRPLIERHGSDFESWPHGPKTWMSEIVWREFYRGVMESFPRCSRRLPLQEWTERVAWRDDPEGFMAWSSGQTGIDIVDAAMQQLLQTGWMHNRMRMVVAMFLTKNLLIDWRQGEAFFAEHLVDYDFASNNGGWQWAASTGTDAAPYFRIFNPERQAETWDTKGTYIATWLDRPAGSLPPICDLKQSRQRAIAAFKAAKDPQAASSEPSLFAESMSP